MADTGAYLPSPLVFDASDPNAPKPLPPPLLPIGLGTGDPLGLPSQPPPAGPASLPATVTNPPSPNAPVPTQAPLAAAKPAPSGPAPSAPQVAQLPDMTSLFDKLNEPPDPNAASAEEALSKKILEYVDSLGQRPAPHVPMTTGEVMSIGLLGGLDPKFFESVVLPTLAYERDLPRQALQDRQHQIGLQLQALEMLAKIREAHADKAENRAFKVADLKLQVENMRRGVAQFNAAQQGEFEREKMREGSAERRTQETIQGRAALKRMPDEKEQNDINNELMIERQTQAALDFIKAHPGKVSMSPLFLSKNDPQLAAFDALIGDLRTSFVTGRGGKRITEPELNLFGGTIPMRGATKTETEIVAALQQIQNWARTKRALTEGDLGAPLEQFKNQRPAAPPAYMVGDVPLGLSIPDDQLE